MIDQLRELGIGEYEARIIDVLLADKIDARKLSKKANVPFGKVYSILKDLKDKNIVQETNSRPKLLYIEDAAGFVDKLISKRQDKDRQVFELLRENVSTINSFQNAVSRFFDIGTSVEDNKRIQLRSFAESNEEVLQIINIHHKPSSNRASKTIWEKEIEKAIGRGVRFRSIYPVGVDLPTILEKLSAKSPKLFSVKRLDTDFCRCDIIDGKKVLIKLVQKDPLQFGGVFFIENEKLAENLKRIFEEMWTEAN